MQLEFPYMVIRVTPILDLFACGEGEWRALNLLFCPAKTVNQEQYTFWLWVVIEEIDVIFEDLKWRWQTFSGKGQMINILDFVGFTVSVATTQLRSHSKKQPRAIRKQMVSPRYSFFPQIQFATAGD